MTGWLQRRILNELRRVPGRVISTHEIADAVYADREDGGPTDATTIVRSVIWRMKRRGAPIITHGKRGRSLAQTGAVK